MSITEVQEVESDERDYAPPTVKGVVFRWKDRPSFDQCLCEVPDEIHILATGQVIARYHTVTEGPLTTVKSEDGTPQRVRLPLKADVPDLPYEDLDDMLEEHCQGVLKPNDLRARLQETPCRDVAYTRAKLEEIKKNAERFYGSFAVVFKPRLVG